MRLGWLVRLLPPRPDTLFILLEELADKIDAGVAVFAELEIAASCDHIAAVDARLEPIEGEADDICRRLYGAIDRECGSRW